MATIGGPNTEKDNLVFGYDTGYGVADNSTTTRFYPGESTTNNTIQTGYSWHGDGTNQSFANKGVTTITDNSLKYNGYGTVLWTPGSSLNCYLNGSSDLNLNDNSTIWTFSCYVKRDDGAAITSLSVYMYYPGSDGSASGTIVDCGNGWYRVSRTRTGTSDNIGLAGFTGFSSSHKYYLSGVMLTKNNHTVPYVNVQSSRSSTASLIDLKRTADIDLSTVSFDSTGQPTFDGSNDQVVVDVDDIVRTASNVTIEGMVNATSISSAGPWAILTDHATTSDKDGFWWHYNIGNAVYFRVEDATAGESGITFSGAVPFVANTYQHIVTVVGDNNVKVYVNGVLSKSYTPNFKWNRIDSSKTAHLHIGRTYPNYYLSCAIPVFKIHSRELSATEIKQNFNAYKNRFDI